MKNLIHQAWEIYRFHTEGNGVVCTDVEKFHWYCGFAACMGVLSGTLPVGIPEHTLTLDVMTQLQTELDELRQVIHVLEAKAKDETERRNKV